ncbi:MAG: hypothetical protein AB7G39_19725 [Alphaproteobacteria bacterium]
MRILIMIALTVGSSAALAQGLPACARSGSPGVLFNGLPTLRLSDVVDCPPDSYSIVQGMFIDGEPMVQFNPVGKDCVAGASPNVVVNGQAATRAGDVVCPPKG